MRLALGALAGAAALTLGCGSAGSSGFGGDSAGTPPMLVNGKIQFAGVAKDGGTPTSSASGTWSATWVSAN